MRLRNCIYDENKVDLTMIVASVNHWLIFAITKMHIYTQRKLTTIQARLVLNAQGRLIRNCKCKT